MKKLLLIILLFCIIQPGEACVKEHVVFSNGKTEYAIVVSSTASESEKFAAAELKYYIDSIGQVSIPIVDCGKGSKGKRIIVGYNSDSQRLFPQMKEPSSDDDGFTYKNKGGDIIIVGGKDRGTMYGVFSFLENEFNCRWFAEDCTVVPQRQEFSFSKLNHSESPSFSKRSMFFTECKDEVFKLHCRLNERIVTAPSNPRKQIGGAYSFFSPHTMKYLLPVEKYYDTHPEYFALVNGKRKRDKPQPCFSNPEVLKICISEMRSIMINNPKLDVYSISCLDNMYYCECDDCKRMTELLGNYSDVALNFVNMIADSLGKEFPDKQFEYLAYRNTEVAPKTIKPLDNVVVRLCGENYCHIHGFQSCETAEARQFIADLSGWSKLTDQLYFWEYAANFLWYNIPYPNLKAIQENFQVLKEYELKEVFVEGNHHSNKSEFAALKVYVIGKLLWNPNCDMDAIIDEFLDGYYGAAAPAIRRYLNLIYSSVKDSTHLPTMASYKENYYSKDIVEKGGSIFQNAKRMADSELTRNRVEVEEVSLMVLNCLINTKDPSVIDDLKTMRKVTQREDMQVGRKSELEIFKKIESGR